MTLAPWYLQADIKVFLTLNPATRAHRRAVQQETSATGNDAKVDAKSRRKSSNIKARDKADSGVKAGTTARCRRRSSRWLFCAEVIAAIIVPASLDSAKRYPQSRGFSPGKWIETILLMMRKSHTEELSAPKKSSNNVKAFCVALANSFDDYYGSALADFSSSCQVLLVAGSRCTGLITKNLVQMALGQ